MSTNQAQTALPYTGWLKQEFSELVESLDLEPMQKRFICSRWLEQVVWMEGKADEARRRYYALRLTTVVGAVLVPGLVTLTTVGGTVQTVGQIATSVISLIVAASAAIEQFFHFGERWQNYRQTVEQLKAEGWLFLQLTGHYAVNGTGHAALYPVFAERVEQIVQTNVKTYLTEVVVDHQDRRGKDSDSGG